MLNNILYLHLRMTKEVNFKVGMTCDGCKGAVTRILQKIEGKSFCFCSIIIFNNKVNIIKEWNLLMLILIQS